MIIQGKEITYKGQPYPGCFGEYCPGVFGCDCCTIETQMDCKEIKESGGIDKASVTDPPRMDDSIIPGGEELSKEEEKE